MRFVTINTGSRYPDWYTDVLRKSLGDGANLVPTIYRMDTLDEIGWWIKTHLFDKRSYRRPFLFCDVDSLFLKDPKPIIDFCQSLREQDIPFAALRDGLKEGINTSLMYIDNSEGALDIVWEEAQALAEKHSPKKGALGPSLGEYRGDQNFVYDVLQRHCIPYLTFPAHFMGFYPCWFKAPDGSPRRARCGYDELEEDDFISWTFWGRGDPHLVVKHKMPGWEKFAPFYEGIEL